MVEEIGSEPECNRLEKQSLSQLYQSFLKHSIVDASGEFSQAQAEHNLNGGRDKLIRDKFLDGDRLSKIEGGGRDFAKALYCQMNQQIEDGGIEEAYRAIEELRMKRAEWLQNRQITQTEGLFLQRLISSFLMQVRHNETEGLRLELNQQIASETAWAEPIGYAATHSGYSKQETQFVVNAAAQIIAEQRRKLIERILPKTQDPEHILYGISPETLENLIAVAERRVIEMIKGDKYSEAKRFSDYLRVPYSVKTKGKEEEYLIDRQVELAHRDSMREAAGSRREPSVGRLTIFSRLAARIGKSALTAPSLASVLISALGLSPYNMPQAQNPIEALPYPQYAQHKGLQQVFGPTPPPDTQENQKIPPSALKDCLRLVFPGPDGSQGVWTYADNSGAREANALCAEFGAGRVLRQYPLYSDTLKPHKIDIPEGYEGNILVDPKTLVGFKQKGPTCKLTTIASIINTILAERRGTGVVDPYVVSDILRFPDNKIGDELPLKALNDVEVDAQKLLEIFGIEGREVDLNQQIGSERAGKSVFFDWRTENSAQRLLDYFLRKLQEGYIPTLTSVVSLKKVEKNGRLINVKHKLHVVAVIGGGIDPKTGEPYLIAFETNGGYTGWEFTKGKWERIGDFLVRIPINAEEFPYIMSKSPLFGPGIKGGRKNALISAVRKQFISVPIAAPY